MRAGAYRARSLPVKNVLIIVGCLFGLLGLGWLFAMNGWLMSKTFMLRMEQVRRDTFVQSQAYNEGQAQQLEDFQQQYITATPAQKAMLRTVILHRYAGVNTSRLPSADQSFLSSLQEPTP
jgi:hypothetical protein